MMNQLEGLNHTVQVAMYSGYQARIINTIRQAAQQLKTSCTVSKKGITPDFVDALADEGFECISAQTEGKVLITWDDIE